MNLTKILFIILSFFFLISNPTVATEKISFLDMEYVVKNSNIGKKLLNKINVLNDKNIETLKLKDEKLKKIEENIKTKQNILSKEELDKELNDLKSKIKDFRIEKDKMVKNINEIKKKELNILYKKINPIIQSYMDKNNINILLDIKTIVVGNTNSNVTNDIINEINIKIN